MLELQPKFDQQLCERILQMGGCKRFDPLHRNPTTQICTEKRKNSDIRFNNHTQQAKNSATETAEENPASKEAQNHVNVGVAAANAAEAVVREVANPSKAPAARE